MTQVSSFDHGQSRALRLTAIAAAKSVAPQLKDAFRSDMDIEFKKDRRDIVTAHDKAAEFAICAHLSAAVPDSSFVGEESGVHGAGGIQWFIDPIDGTANFARGLPSWCISIGAVYEDQIVAGAIVDPMGGNVFSADLMGAYHGEASCGRTAHPTRGWPPSFAATRRRGIWCWTVAVWHWTDLGGLLKHILLYAGSAVRRLAWRTWQRGGLTARRTFQSMLGTSPRAF